MGLFGDILGGLFGGDDDNKSSSSQPGVVIPPTVQEAYNIIKGMEGQVGDIASKQYNIEAPYLNEALSIFRGFPDQIQRLYGDTESGVAQRYASLFDNIQNQMNNQWNKSALGLSAMGLYNSPATQLTQSDIVDKLFGRVAGEEVQTLNSLDANKLKNLTDYYSNAPQVLATFANTFSGIDPDINKYQMQMQLAGVLNGLNTAIYPKISPLAQAGKLLGNAIMQSSGLPSFGSMWNGISSLFGGGNSGGFLSNFSGEVGDAVGSAFDDAGGFFGDVAEDAFDDIADVGFLGFL